MNLRFLIVPIMVFLISGLGLSQDDNGYSFEVTNTSSKEMKNKYTEAINSADLDNYRMVDQKRELVFLDGTRVLLNSANEEGQKLSKERYPQNKVYPTRFKLHESGVIVEIHENPNKVKPNNK